MGMWEIVQGVALCYYMPPRWDWDNDSGMRWNADAHEPRALPCAIICRPVRNRPYFILPTSALILPPCYSMV